MQLCVTVPYSVVAIQLSLFSCSPVPYSVVAKQSCRRGFFPSRLRASPWTRVACGQLFACVEERLPSGCEIQRSECAGAGEHAHGPTACCGSHPGPRRGPNFLIGGIDAQPIGASHNTFSLSSGASRQPSRRPPFPDQNRHRDVTKSANRPWKCGLSTRWPCRRPARRCPR